MLKLVAWALAVLVALGLTMTAIGWLLPVAHVATRSTTLSATPDKVFAIVSDIERYPTWWSDVSQIEMLPAASGRVRFRQHDRSDSIVMEIVETTPPARLVTRIADPDQPFGGTWTWEIAPHGDGARLTLTERGEIYNPFFRFMARFVFGHAATVESHLTALTAALAERR